ncbi:MAG TPA: hypothetical protein VFY18_14235 [Candidatus Limnocylindrales bacterium]|nr:hypothetical protein [Candidatus Limnocylindrales bacterium]
MTRGSIRRRSWLLVVATALAVAGGLAPVTAPPAAAAGDELSVSAATTYTIQPAKHVVQVVVDLTATNNKPDITSGGKITRFFWQSAKILVQPEVRNVRATSGGASLTTSVEPVDGAAIVEARFRSGLFYHETIKVRVSFDLPGGAPRSKSDIRVGTAFATFVAWAFGDSGSVRIVVPAGFEAETTGSQLTRTSSGGATVLRATGISDVAAWYAVVNADREASLTRDRIDLPGGEHFVIRAWPEDAEWRKRVSALLTDGLPELVELIGLDWPVAADLGVFEVHTPLLEGYAGVFFENQDKIEISEDLDDLTILHEASHAWFNGDLFSGRWLNEGFADTYAARALDAVGNGGWVPDKVGPTDKAALPLADWTHPGRINDAKTSAREHYGYEASWTVIRLLVSEIGVEGMQAVLQAARDREIAYVGAVEPEKVGGAADWQRFLDLLDEDGGSTTADDVFRRWVVGPADQAQLDARAIARTAYHGLAESGGDWLPPAYVRTPMSSWDFAQAEDRIPEAAAVLAHRDELTALVATIGIDAPTSLRTAYETATTSLDAARQLVASEITAARALVAAQAALNTPRDTFELIGLIGTTPDADMTAALSAFQLGAADAAERADAVTALLGGAGAVGQNRVVLAILVLLAVALAIALAGHLIRRRRAASRVSVGSTSYATLPDQPAVAEVGPTPAPPEERDEAP